MEVKYASRTFLRIELEKGLASSRKGPAFGSISSSDYHVHTITCCISEIWTPR